MLGGIRTEVITQPADKAVDFAESTAKEYLKKDDEFEYANLSDAYPIYLNGVLHYTITITLGYYI